ncbi:hypothetical protein [Afipia sp. GAS231]|uniref:hypothetical protein n=1 Tax=Afipia sp. GAS231 TaxID=1882747 RepID=UPI001FCCE80E|nr:hypothetical protein [Afipia sp. GAS231]
MATDRIAIAMRAVTTAHHEYRLIRFCQSGKQLKQFGWIHAMACPSENTLFVAELLNWRVQKLILKP